MSPHLHVQEGWVVLESGQVLCVREGSPEEHRYQLQQQLGHNSGRQTWLALDLATEPPESVIVKLLAFNPQMQWDDFKLFEREAQVLKNLNHPRIPRYRDYFSLDKQKGAGLCWFGLVQDYIPGASLQQLLKEGRRFTEAQVRAIALSVLNILIYLHELSPPLLHRDIKPSNLILGSDKEIYLVDFGAVQNQAAKEGVTFTVVGTSGYAPLEQFWGRAVPASDLYALGATLIHLLTGTSPGNLPCKDLRIQFRDKVSLNSNLISWIEALTEPDLDRRFSSAREAIEALKTGRAIASVPLYQISQPAKTRVQLSKSPERLKIKIPGGGAIALFKFIISSISSFGKFIILASSWINLLALSLLIIMLLFILFLVITHYYYIFPIVLVILGIIGLLWTGVVRELNKVPLLQFPRLTSLSEYSLNLDRDKFTIERRLFGFCYLRHFGKTPHIQEVKQIFFKELSFQTLMLEYNFGQQLTETERKWLAEEIRNWLT
ncbi:serine/threonine-protein kinase [Microcoleus sp. FACHB-831]|uniref:serine/threonine protein kinase n=1 Tax=Microcoleus sp. FACHB-831 TaxID=2692827 RepID=UPI002814D6DA|nr:serine/threonine-protein kinase [Microcoleus sp. FACHB-831]